MTPEVLFCDNHLLAVCKPAGLPVQQDRSADPDLVTLLKGYVKQRFDKPGKVYLGLVHRLDRPVSGVMVLARTSKAAARLSEQFRTGTARKRYIALVDGAVTGRGRCEDCLCKERETVRIVAQDYPGAMRAELFWHARAARGGLSLLDVDLKTGRPHQIRVQLAARGMHILGDFRYKSRREFDGRNLALHCYRLGVAHPVLQTRKIWTAPPPETWRGFFAPEIEALLKLDSTGGDACHGSEKTAL